MPNAFLRGYIVSLGWRDSRLIGTNCWAGKLVRVARERLKLYLLAALATKPVKVGPERPHNQGYAEL